MSDNDEEFEVRADHVDEETLRTGTVVDDWFEEVHDSLLSRTLTLLVGPRGCGKTHMMRYTWLQCMEDAKLPFAAYVSFNRYLRLEPLLKSRVDAPDLFHTWVLARIALAIREALERCVKDLGDYRVLNIDTDKIKSLVGRLERGLDLDSENLSTLRELSVDRLVEALEAATAKAGRRRTVLLLDDAALTLTPEYLIEFFDVVRAVKTHSIAPKCSVYPGTTQYGPRFHASNEGRIISVWLSVNHPQYTKVMTRIGELRYPEGLAKVSKDVNEVLIYTAFGVPRAYLALLRSYVTKEGGHGGAGELNRVVQEHRDAKLAEYRTLEQKIPRFSTVVRTGEEFLQSLVEAIRVNNATVAQKRNEKQIFVGIEDTDFAPLLTRMVQFLIEAGLLYEHSQVSHGSPSRVYRRFTPHFAALIAARAFQGSTKSSAASSIVEGLNRRSTKHPVRRKISTLLSKEAINGLKIDLPPCQNCQTPRSSPEQKFCMHCGTRLSDPSTFSRLMVFPIIEISDLSIWKRQTLSKHGITTIGELLAYQDPGTELRKIPRIGAVRAEQVINVVETYVDEFMS